MPRPLSIRCLALYRWARPTRSLPAAYPQPYSPPYSPPYSLTYTLSYMPLLLSPFTYSQLPSHSLYATP